MKKYYIISLFVLVQSMHLHADSSVTGAALFGAAIVGVNYLRLHKPTTTPQETLPSPESMINQTRTAQALEQVNKLNPKRINNLEKNLKNRKKQYVQEQFSGSDNCDKNKPTDFLRSSRNQYHNSIATTVIQVPRFTSSSTTEYFTAPNTCEQGDVTPYRQKHLYQQKPTSSLEEIEYYKQLTHENIDHNLQPLTNCNDQRHQKNLLDGYIGQTEVAHYTNPNVVAVEYDRGNIPVKTGVKDNNAIISHERTFFPTTSTPKGTKYIFCIHGTKANKGTSFGDDQDNVKSQYLINYAQQTAFQEQCCVKLCTVKWNGELSETARQKSGISLANKVHDIISLNHGTVEFIAHSYGCDVAREAITHLPPQTVTSLFALASPKTELNISELTKEIHVYGDLDGIATAADFMFSPDRDTCLHNDKAYNIRFKINDEDTNHKSILEALKYKDKISKIIDSNPGTTSLYCNVVTQNNNNNNSLNNANNSTIIDVHSDDHFESISEEEIKTLQSDKSTIIDVDSDDHFANISEEKIKTLQSDKSTYTITVCSDHSQGTENRRTYAESVYSEAESHGVAHLSITKTVTQGVAALEWMLSGKKSPNNSLNLKNVSADNDDDEWQIVNTPEEKFQKTCQQLAQAVRQTQGLSNQIGILAHNMHDARTATESSSLSEEEVQNIITNTFQNTRTEIERRQGYSALIINKTRSIDNNYFNLPDNKRKELQQAAQVYQQCKGKQKSDILIKAMTLQHLSQETLEEFAEAFQAFNDKSITNDVLDLFKLMKLSNITEVPKNITQIQKASGNGSSHADSYSDDSGHTTPAASP